MGTGRLEMFKFSLYLAIPVAASVIYSAPETMQGIVKHFNYIQYPPQGKKPPTSSELEEYLRKQKETK
ncbi:unnamed protein product [Heterosigma akashiwo]